MKKLTALFLILTVFINLGFSASKTGKVKDFTPDEGNVRLLGRTIYENETAILTHSGTGIEFNVSAKKLSVTFVKDSWHRNARIVAFFNNERILDEILRADSKEFILFDSKDLQTGVVRIIQVSECLMANSGIKKITTDAKGEIFPTEEKSRKIEFIGDSATAAYGVDETNPRVSFRIETEDITKSYAYKTALELDADYSIVCGSGWGVVSGYTNGPKKSDSLIPDVYDKAGFFDVMVEGVKPGESEWSFNRFRPDIITILLGANDQNYTKNEAEKCREFKDAYVKFIKDIRSKNPDSYILCCSGIAPDELHPQIQAAVSEYTSQSKDNNVGYLHIPLHNGEEEGWGADWHPTDKTYTKAADFICRRLSEILQRAGQHY